FTRHALCRGQARMDATDLQAVRGSGETQSWRPHVGIAELGKDILDHLSYDGREPVTMVMVELDCGRPAENRLASGRASVDIGVELGGVPRRTVMVEFAPHAGDKMMRDGDSTADWKRAEGPRGRDVQGEEHE